MRAVFAIPGDMYRKTGGFIYEAEAWAALNRIGIRTRHLEVPDSFPDAAPADMAATIAALSAVPADVPVILDGFIVGGADPAALKEVRAPLIGMVHHPLGLETGLGNDRAAWLITNEAAVLRLMAHVLVPSRHTGETLTRQFGVSPDRITVAPPGFASGPHIWPRPARTAGPARILSVGLMAPRKGHDILLTALADIADLDWQAEIVGRPHDDAVVQALTVQRGALGLTRRVAFAGEVADAGLARRYATADIFALATRYEGYGMVFGEAMRAGLPLVSCDTGAVPDTVGDAGILVPPGDATAFAAALRRLLTEPALRNGMASASHERGAALPGWDDTARIMAGVIARLAG